MNEITEYIPHRVYLNLRKFLEYRSLELVSGHVVVGRVGKSGSKKDGNTKEWLTDKKFTQHLQLDGYVIVECADSANKVRRYPKNIPVKVRELVTRTFIVVIDPNSKYSTASANFVKLLSRIPDFNSKKRTKNLEIMVITKVLMKSNIHKKIEQYITPGGTDGAPFLLVHNFPYRAFTSVIPEHILVAPHRLVSKDEEQKLLQEIHTEKKHLPKIKKSGPIMIWLGGVVGDMVECLIRSESTGVERKYMVVIKGT